MLRCVAFTKNTYNRHIIIILDISPLSKHFFPQKTQYILGIDTGGTYTDAALCRETSEGLRMQCSAKARTTKENLTIGIRNAVAGLDRELLKNVARVSLSTTLATNACSCG